MPLVPYLISCKKSKHQSLDHPSQSSQLNFLSRMLALRNSITSMLLTQKLKLNLRMLKFHSSKQLTQFQNQWGLFLVLTKAILSIQVTSSLTKLPVLTTKLIQVVWLKSDVKVFWPSCQTQQMRQVRNKQLLKQKLAKKLTKLLLMQKDVLLLLQLLQTWYVSNKSLIQLLITDVALFLPVLTQKILSAQPSVLKN